MFHELASHNDDLRRLLERGYAVAFDSNHLVVRDVPYLDGEGGLQMGAIVAKLEFIDQERVTQTDHQVFFAGSVPHGLDGNPIPNLGVRAASLTLSEACSDVAVQWALSNKPKATGRFADFFDKVESYVAIISGPAMDHRPGRYGRVRPGLHRKDARPGDSGIRPGPLPRTQRLSVPWPAGAH